MRPYNLFADEAGPSTFYQQPRQSANAHDLSNPNETNDDDNEHMVWLEAQTPAPKRQQLNVVNLSPVKSTSPSSTSVVYAFQVQLLEMRLAEQVQKFA